MIFSTLIVASFVLGVILGARKTAYGLAWLLAILSATSSLPFQLGLTNIALIPVYLLGLVGAGWASTRRRRDPTPGQPDETAALRARLATWTAMTVLIILVASLLAILRRHVTAAVPAVLGDPVDLFVFAPQALPGEIQAGYIALIGPLLFLVALRTLREDTDRLLVRRAFTAGIGAAVIAPVVQAIALTPWVRPDQRTYVGTGITGLVGFFQDPHSYAAYLVVSITFCVGLALGHARAGKARPATGYAVLGALAMVVLLYTNSRSGLISTLGALLVLLLLILSSPHMSAQSRRWRSGFLVATLLLAVCAAVVLGSAPAREAVYHGLAKLGNPRMWEILRTDPLELLAGRVARLQKAWVIVRTNPVWGLGPNGFQMTSVDIPGIRPAVLAVHPHNYFVQLATEYGLPGAACFVVLVGMILSCTAGGAYRAGTPIDRGLLAGIAAGQVGILTFSLVQHPLLLSELQAVYWTVSALGVATVVYAPARQSRSSKSRPASIPKNGVGAANGGAPPPA